MADGLHQVSFETVNLFLGVSPSTDGESSWRIFGICHVVVMYENLGRSHFLGDHGLTPKSRYFLGTAHSISKVRFRKTHLTIDSKLPQEQGFRLQSTSSQLPLAQEEQPTTKQIQLLRDNLCCLPDSGVECRHEAESQA